MEPDVIKQKLCDYLVEHLKAEEPREARRRRNGTSSLNLGLAFCLCPLKVDFNELYAKKKSETFSEMLTRLVEESGETTFEIYNRANVDRQLFSKIKRNAHYKPAKDTAIAFALALRLDLDKTKDFLAAAGYALSNSSKRDVIIAFFIEHEIFDISVLDDCLNEYEEPVLFSR